MEWCASKINSFEGKINVKLENDLECSILRISSICFKYWIWDSWVKIKSEIWEKKSNIKENEENPTYKMSIDMLK